MNLKNSNFETECKLFIQHLVPDNDCCISRNVGKLVHFHILQLILDTFYIYKKILFDRLKSRIIHLFF